MSKYISLENLERYDSKMQEHFASFCASKEDGMWRQTEKAGAVQFWPVGNSPLEGTVEFMFKETGPASGTKSPDNPSTISGVSSVKVTRCGKNLLKSSIATDTKNGVTCTNNGDGTYTLDGTATADVGFSMAPSPNLPDGTYKLSGCPSSGSLSTYFLGASGGPRDTGSGVEVVQTAYGARGIWISVFSGTTVSNLVFKPQLELGSTATSFEPYEGADYTVNLGSTYYGGSIDLATGLMTVDWEYVSIDRFSSCYINSSTIRFSYNTDFDTTGYAYGQDPVGACNRFDVVPGGDTEFARQTGNTRELYVAINKSRLDVSGAADPSNPTASEWLAAGNAWLVEHPVVFVAKRAAPYTVQLTPPQIRSLPQPDKYVPRLNTVYTDAENVQIVYQKNPVRDKFEKVQAIIAQGGNV